MAKWLVVYGSKYGSTQEVAQSIADGLGADIANAATHPDVRPYDVVVIGSPIYGGEFLPSVRDFVRVNRPLLAKRKIATFITAAAQWERSVGLTGEEDDLVFTQQEYADGLARLAGGEVLNSRGFGGRLDPEVLDQHDRSMLEWFYQWLMREPLQGFDLIDLPEAYRWGEDLREIVGGA
jgi:menaquinone-dependent protoporphyrinogen oxidase